MNGSGRKPRAGPRRLTPDLQRGRRAIKLIISAIGRLRAGPEQTLIDDYLKRGAGMGGALGLSGPSLIESEAPKALRGPMRQAREGELLLASLPDNAAVIALDERGANLSSEDFAAMIARYRDEGRRACAFLIGGADGHDASVKRAAVKTLSFGAATWPHMLVRVMLSEQLYRAMTILAGHPYHRS